VKTLYTDTDINEYFRVDEISTPTIPNRNNPQNSQPPRCPAESAHGFGKN